MGLAVQVNDHCLYCGEMCWDDAADAEYVTIKRGRYRVKQWFHKGCYTKEECAKCNHSKPEQ